MTLIKLSGFNFILYLYRVKYKNLNAMKTKSYQLTGQLITLLSIIIMATSVKTQPLDSLWFKEYGNIMDDIGFDAIEADEGEYIVVGKTQVSQYNWDGYAVKLDINGDIIWEKTYGGAQNEQLQSIAPGLYFGYVITGYTSTDSNGLSDIWILFIDDNGDSLASVKYGNWASDQGYYIRPTVDQGFIVVSRSEIYQWGDQVHLMKLDVGLDTVWTKLYGGPMQDYGRCVEETSDYGYIIAGRSYTTPYPESGDAWVIKTDSNGDTIWTKKYGGDDEDIFYSLLETDDGYIFVGQTWSFGAGLKDVYVVRTDDNGDTIWTRTYGGEGAEMAYRIFEAEDGNYVVAGYYTSYSGDNRDVYVIKIDGDGNLIWEEFYGDSNDSEYMYGGAPTSDGGYVFTGRVDYFSGSEDDLFVLKIGKANSGIDFNRTENNSDFYNYPNPIINSTTFNLNIPAKSFVELTIYNSFGQKIETIIQKQLNGGHQEIEWDAGNLPDGIYFCKLETLNNVLVRKILISR